MKIKICGLFRSIDIEYVNEAKPDYIGFVFAESRRKVTPEMAAVLKGQLDSSIKAVGVFVDNDIDFAAELVHNKIIDAVQLHGSEDAEYVRLLRERISADIPVIKAFSVGSREDIERAAGFPCDYVLLDNGKGGTGKSFAWQLLSGGMPDRVFLAGGVNTDNINEAIKLKPYCIDVSSGAETNGIKDREKIIKLVSSVNH